MPWLATPNGEPPASIPSSLDSTWYIAAHFLEDVEHMSLCSLYEAPRRDGKGLLWTDPAW